MEIRQAKLKDLEEVCDLAWRLFGGAREGVQKEISESLRSESKAVFVALSEGVGLDMERLDSQTSQTIDHDIQKTYVGFAYVSLRSEYVEGIRIYPAGYLEGIYLKEDFRGKGYARSLLGCCEQWALDKGAYEFGSDCKLDNHASASFHRALGFEEVNKIICFKKVL